MSLSVKDVKGKTHTIHVSENGHTTVLEIKHILEEKFGIPPDAQRLVSCGKQLEDDKTTLEYNIQEQSLIYLLLRLKGSKPIILLYPLFQRM
ncbi:unnamed protein product [Choristocarpus tenellus]